MPPDPSDRRSENGTLDSWKAIAAYMQRQVRTVQRWERSESLPVRRHQHQKQATVYAYKDELDAWLEAREHQLANESRQFTSKAWTSVIVVSVLLVSGLAVYLIPGQITTENVRPLIVVLPFEELGAEPMPQLADGLTEELSTQLAVADPANLGVIARSSAMSFKGRDASPDEIRQELDVDYLVEGSIRRDGDNVRIAVRLVETAGQIQRWAASYDYNTQPWLSLQERATADIVRELNLALGLAAPTEPPATARDAEAVEHVRLGYRYFDQFDPDTLPQAINHFSAAVEIDSTLVRAHVGLAQSYCHQAFFGGTPVWQGHADADKWAASALALDAWNADAVAVQGWVQFAYRWEWDNAERSFQQAIALGRNSPWPHWYYANYLSALDRPDEAIEMITAARRLDPVSEYTNIALGYILINAGMPDDAIQHLTRVSQRTESRSAQRFLWDAYEAAGDFDGAVRILEEMDRSDASAVRQAFDEDGEMGYWRALRKGYDARAERVPDKFSWHRAVVLTKLGEFDKAIEELERGYYQRSGTMAYLQIYDLDPLYSDPRFQDLLRRMAFPDQKLHALSH
jgi:TolB-like protein